MQRTETFVLEASQLNEGERKVVPFGDTEVGIYRMKRKLYAYRNVCAHQGGPACEGLLMPQVEDVIAADKTYQGRRFNYDEWHIICPWHAWEYDLETGEFVVDRRFRLKKYAVVEENGKIYIRTG